MWRTANPIGDAVGRHLVAATACFMLAAGLTGCAASTASTPTWSAVQSPLPAGAGSVSLEGVSCTTATSCFAVGNFSDGSSNSYKTLVVRWNGHKWSVVTSPNPKSATLRQLSGISCPTAKLCFAVGVANNQAALQQWNGMIWAVVPAPKIAGVRDSRLYGVSCATATSCFAVGTFRDASGPRKTLIERWTGTSWTVVAHPKLTGGHRYLYGVSCASATSCFAVGTHSVTGGGNLACEPEIDCSASTLVEHWNGKRWAVVPSPNGAGPTLQSTLAGVSCASPTSCVAVGTASPRETWGKVLTERWNGKQWSVVSGAAPAGAIGSALYGVSCVDTTNCYAAGSYQTPGNNSTIIDRYRGTSWSIAYRANLSGRLRGISCASASSCVAVGGTSIQRLG